MSLTIEEQVFKQGATAPKIGLTVTGLDVDPTSATATFYMNTREVVKADGSGALIATGSAIISDVALVNSLYSFIVTYSWASGDTNTLGEYYGEFKIDLGSTGILKLPQNTYIPIRIVNSVG